MLKRWPKSKEDELRAHLGRYVVYIIYNQTCTLTLSIMIHAVVVVVVVAVVVICHTDMKSRAMML